MNARDKNFHAIIGKAIAQAEYAAPTDHATFLIHLRNAVAAQTRTDKGRALEVAPKPPKGARLADDPRYLDNIRKLVKQKPNERIVGGSTVDGHEFDDCVAVGDDASFGCTGTLIAPNVVLTAAHCQALHTRVFVGNSLSKKGREFRVRKHIRHAKFDKKFNNDVMILILEKKVTGVKPRGFATKALIDRAITARVVGFGTTDTLGTQGFGLKRKTDVPIVSQGCCGKVKGKSDEGVYGCHSGREIVAGKPLFLHDTCKGDSGGPFFVQDAKGCWLLAGVTSRGTDLAVSMCGDGGLYVRVDAYADWIASALRQA
jgi:secreted trypsin-like serine protease